MNKFFENFYNFAGFGPEICSVSPKVDVLNKYKGKLPENLLISLHLSRGAMYYCTNWHLYSFHLREMERGTLLVKIIRKCMAVLYFLQLKEEIDE